MTYLGLDLGTGFVKLANCRSDGQPRGGASVDVTTMQAAVTFLGRYAAEIPAGYPEERRVGRVRCDGFPALLGTALTGEEVAAWGDRTASEVARGYLRCLFEVPDTVPDGVPANPRDAGALDSVRDADANAIVVAVPPGTGTRLGADDDRTVGSELHDFLAGLGRPPMRLVAAPVAALLWLREHNPDLAAARRVVVIDAGAGAIDLSICIVTGHAIRVADSVRLVGGSAWGERDPQESAGGSIARPPALAERLAMALAASAGLPAGSAGWESTYWWRTFEGALADEDAADRLDAVLQLAVQARSRYGSTPAIRFGGLEVNASQLLDACEPLARQSVTALAQLVGRQGDLGRPRLDAQGGDGLVLLGGLTVLRPIRAALLESLGLDADRPGSAVTWPRSGDLRDAVASGAALLAAGLADPGDRYPHALRLVVHRAIRGELVPGGLELAAPGSIDLELTRTVYLTEGGSTGPGGDVIVTVPPATGPRAMPPPGVAPIAVEVVPSDGEPVAATFEPAPPPGPGSYRVGVRGGPAGPAVVLLPVTGGEPLAYPLSEATQTVPDRPRGKASR
jgi:hypothetical protein